EYTFASCFERFELASQSASVALRTSGGEGPPVTLFTRMSAPSSQASQCARHTLSTPSSVARSAATASTSPPHARSSASAARSRSGRRAQMVTRAPSLAGAPAVAAEQDGRVRPLHRLRPRPERLEAHEFALEGRLVLGPDALHGEHALAQHAPALLEVGAVVLHLLGVPPAADAEEDAP